jgi:hypothetical protein
MPNRRVELTSHAEGVKQSLAVTLYWQEEGTMYANRMYLKVLAIILTVVIVLPFASFGADSKNPEEVIARGTIQKQGITTYMYGTHVLLDDNGRTLYALRSDSIDLNKYVNRKVTVKGYLVNGYPVDSGPNYLNVKFIE